MIKNGSFKKAELIANVCYFSSAFFSKFILSDAEPSAAKTHLSEADVYSNCDAAIKRICV